MVKPKLPEGPLYKVVNVSWRCTVEVKPELSGSAL